jgi:hypothetical protein
MIGKKITKKVTYEITVTDLSREIPKEYEESFLSWLGNRTDCSPGFNREFFLPTGYFNDDIAVEFKLNIINDEKI